MKTFIILGNNIHMYTEKNYILSKYTHMYVKKIRIKCLLNSNKISYTTKIYDDENRRKKIVMKSDVKIIHVVM